VVSGDAASASLRETKSTTKSAKDDASDFPFAIELGEIYEGPLDLLLDLIRKQDIDIYDIPIATGSQRSTSLMWSAYANST
jgi:hypothetical protein